MFKMSAWLYDVCKSLLYLATCMIEFLAICMSTDLYDVCPWIVTFFASFAKFCLFHEFCENFAFFKNFTKFVAFCKFCENCNFCKNSIFPNSWNFRETEVILWVSCFAKILKWVSSNNLVPVRFQHCFVFSFRDWADRMPDNLAFRKF